MNDTHDLATPSPCPQCHEVLEQATATQPGKVPMPGNFTVCAVCASVLVFTEQMQLRMVTKADIDLLSFEEVLQLACVKHFIAQMRAPHSGLVN